MKMNLKLFWLFILLGLFLVLTEIFIDHVLLDNLTIVVPYLHEVSAGEMFMRVFLLLSFWILGACIARLFYLTEQVKKEKEEETFFLQQLINSLPSPIFFKDRNCRYLGCNKSFEHFISKPQDEIAGKTVYEISPKHLADEYHKKDLELLQNPGTQVYESKVSRSDGEESSVIFHKATYNDLHGNLNGIIGVILDITDLRKTEVERKTTIEQLQNALAEVKTLSGLIPICASCKKIRDDSGYWQRIEKYIRAHSSAEFSHSICPECSEQLFKEYDADAEDSE